MDSVFLEKAITYDTALKYLTDRDFLMHFMLCKFYGCGSEPEKMSDKFRKAMREAFLRAVRDDQICRELTFLNCIRMYILYDDGEFGRNDFAEWLEEQK